MLRLVILSLCVSWTTAQPRMMGAAEQVSNSSEEIQTAYKEVKRRLAALPQCENAVLGEPINASTQVVSGIKYKWTSTMTGSCLDGEGLYEISYWSRPWLDSTESISLMAKKVSEAEDPDSSLPTSKEYNL